MKQIEKLILKETEGLPLYALNEILDFIRFIKEKRFEKTEEELYKDDLGEELSILDNEELSHLETEIKDYKELYPRE